MGFEVETAPYSVVHFNIIWNQSKIRDFTIWEYTELELATQNFAHILATAAYIVWCGVEKYKFAKWWHHTSPLYVVDFGTTGQSFGQTTFTMYSTAFTESHLHCVWRCSQVPRQLPPSLQDQTPPDKWPEHPRPHSPQQPGKKKGTAASSYQATQSP